MRTIRGDSNWFIVQNAAHSTLTLPLIVLTAAHPLATSESRPYTRYERRRYYEEQYGYRHTGNGFGLLIAGLFVIVLGLAAFTGSWSLFWQYFWPVVLILIGAWLLFWGLRHNRKYRQAPPP